MQWLSASKANMYTRMYKGLISLPPMFWVAVFLLLPYALMFAHSFWTVRDGVILHEWSTQNYAKLFQNPLYLDVLFRSRRCAWCGIVRPGTRDSETASRNSA